MQVVRLEDEIHVRAERYAFPIGERQEMTVVQYRLQRLNPFRVDVTIADDS